MSIFVKHDIFPYKRDLFFKMKFTTRKKINFVFSLPMGSLDDKEPFYAHFPKIPPSPMGQMGEGGRYVPPTPGLTEKSPL